MNSLYGSSSSISTAYTSPMGAPMPGAGSGAQISEDVIKFLLKLKNNNL
jgi:hypothetical protein